MVVIFARSRFGRHVEVDPKMCSDLPGGIPPAFLLSAGSQGITGRFLAAPHDGWQAWPDRLAELHESDLFTLRRIVPRDRGMDWQ